MKEKTKVLLLNVPSRKGRGGLALPLGLLYAAAAAEQNGYEVRLLDLYLAGATEAVDSGNFSHIEKIVDDFKPDIIGYGGIVTSYGRAKRICQHLKIIKKDLVHVAGGQIAAVKELLLGAGGMDAVVVGESEESFPVFIENFNLREKWQLVPGLAFKDNAGGIVITGTSQLADLDKAPYPAYHLVDVTKYVYSMDERIVEYASGINKLKAILEQFDKKIKPGDKYMPLITSRGCTHKCYFCYRHLSGVRRHSVNYVIAHLKFLKEKYGVRGFQFSDELFNSDVQWVMDFCDALDRERLDIFYIIGGARVDKMNRALLTRLRDTGCIEIGYGHESGSDVILKEYRKGVTAQQNLEMTILTQEMGMHSPIQLVIGSPSETSLTVMETIKFLKKINAAQCSLNYLIPLPKTPVWQYASEKGLIGNVEEYLDKIADVGGGPYINLTSVSDEEWSRWRYLILMEIRLNNCGKNILSRALAYLAYGAIMAVPFSMLKRMSPSYKANIRKLVKIVN